MVGLTYIRVWLHVRSFNDRGQANSYVINCCRLLGVGCMFYCLWRHNPLPLHCQIYILPTFMLPVWKWNHQIIIWTASVTGHPVTLAVLDTDICDDDFMHKVSWMQCSWYVSPVQRGKEKVSKIAIILIILMYLVIVVCMIVSLAGPLSWLNYLYILSYIKLAVTVFKYTPQVRWGVTESCMLCAPGAFCQLAWVASCCFLPTTGVRPQN